MASTATFFKILKGALLRPLTSDPTDNLEASLWQNSTSAKIKTYINGSVRQLLTDTDVQTITNKTIIQTYSTTTTASGTTTLTSSSSQLQFFTGTNIQTLVLPVTSTLNLGQSFTVVNNSTNTVTVESSGANSIQILAAGTTAIFTVILTSGTTAASWSVTYISSASANPTVALIINGSPSAAATAGNPIKFPTVVQNTNSGSYSASTGLYTAPNTGFYQVNCFLDCSANANSFIQIYVNGSVYAPIGIFITAQGQASGSGLVYATAGQTIYFAVNISGTGAFGVNSSASIFQVH